MTQDEKKVRDIVDQVMIKLPWDRDIVAPMVAALREEREACAKIAENDDSFMMLQDFGLQSAVTQKGQNIAAAIRSRNDDQNPA